MKHDEGTIRARLLLMPIWLALGVFFLAPMLMMFKVSLHQRGPERGLTPVENWGEHVSSGKAFENYRDTANLGRYGRVYSRSLWIAVATTALCLLIGYPVAYYMAIVASKRWRNLLLLLAVLPFWTSFLVRMLAWKLILSKEGLLNTMLSAISAPAIELLYTPWAVLIGLVYGELPFMILPLYASLEKMDQKLLEAASDLGANSVERFWRVTIPQTMPGIVAGIVLVFVPSVGQFVVSDILGGGKGALVGNIIEDGFVRNRPLKAAMAFELAAFVMLLLVLYGLYARGRKEQLL
jgi:spermidine/putrescine transport system permease protein